MVKEATNLPTDPPQPLPILDIFTARKISEAVIYRAILYSLIHGKGDLY